MSKTKLDYRGPALPEPAAPTPLRQRWTILAAGGLLLVVLIAILAGASAGLVFARLITEGLLLALWLLAAAGFAAFLPLPMDERAASLRGVTRISLGLGIIGLLQLLLGLSGVVSRVSGFAIVVLGVVLLLIRARKLNRHDIEEWLTGPADWEWLWLAALPVLALAIVSAYAPPGSLWGDEPNGYDVTEYHLQLPREFFELHRVAPLHHNVFSYFPQGVEMHYLLAMQLTGGPWAGMYLAQLMHLTFVALTVIAVYATARQFAPKFPAMLAALATVGTPWIALLAPVAYNEGGLLLFSTLAIGWLIHSLTLAELASVEEGKAVRAPACGKSWIIAGAFAGLACGAKLTAVPQVLLMLPVVVAIVARIRGQQRALRGAITFIITGVIAFSPWLVRNTVWTHNPVFPEGQSIFGRAHFTADQSERWHRAHSPTADQQTFTAHLVAAERQILIDWRYGFLFLWFSAVVSLGFCISRPQARVFAAMILLWLIFWLAFTHLQGRFFVLAIPVAALSLALWKYRWQQWETTAIAGIVLVQFCVGCWLDFGIFNQRVGPMRTAGLLGYDDFKPMLPQQAVDLIDRPDGPIIALVGDARAFLYPVPMSRLRYRTVFDVNVKPGQTSTDAWLEGVPPTAEKIVDTNELERFARTYYGIPKPN